MSIPIPTEEEPNLETLTSAEVKNLKNRALRMARAHKQRVGQAISHEKPINNMIRDKWVSRQQFSGVPGQGISRDHFLFVDETLLRTFTWTKEELDLFRSFVELQGRLIEFELAREGNEKLIPALRRAEKEAALKEAALPTAQEAHASLEADSLKIPGEVRLPSISTASISAAPSRPHPTNAHFRSLSAESSSSGGVKLPPDIRHSTQAATTATSTTQAPYQDAKPTVSYTPLQPAENSWADIVEDDKRADKPEYTDEPQMTMCPAEVVANAARIMHQQLAAVPPMQPLPIQPEPFFHQLESVTPRSASTSSATAPSPFAQPNRPSDANAQGLMASQWAPYNLNNNETRERLTYPI